MEPKLWLEKTLKIGRAIIPRSIFTAAQPIYHFLLALLGAIIYRFPSRQLYVLAVTGTKGKTSTIEVANAILEAAGKKTAIASTLRIKIDASSQPNKFKMTIQGRFFLQRFLREAVKAGCTHALIELTSEGAKQFRHRFIALDALIFTNLAREHIEAHGSYENYLLAKLSIATALANSRKPNKLMIVNGDDPVSEKFLATVGNQATGVKYSLNQAKPWQASENGGSLTFKSTEIRTKLPGTFNLQNILAAATWAQRNNINIETIKIGIENLKMIGGRMERIEGKGFPVIVDYAHTPESLQAVYQTFAGRGKVCLLGSTGGGRDRWKRPVMGRIAGEHCRVVILANEDPYDEDPVAIVNEIARGMSSTKPQIVLDRRTAIRAALLEAKPGEVVIITGKGTDPYIMGPKGQRTPWSDAEVVKEELEKLEAKSQKLSSHARTPRS